MNLMYLKNLRGDRDGGTTGLLPGSRSRYRGGIDGGGGSSGAAVGPGSLGVGAGPNSRSWFNSGAGVVGVAGVAGVALARMPSSGAAVLAGTATGAGAGAMNDMQHLRTHLLMDLHTGRHAETSVSYPDEPDRGSGGSRGSASGAMAGANNRWNNSGSGIGGGGGRTSGGDPSSSRADYRYQRVRGDSSTDSANVAGGSRSVRSGLYDTEVCLSVSGLGNVRGTMVTGRSGKQVSFGRDGRSPEAVNERGTMERERSRESEGRETRDNRDKRAVRDRNVSSNKENNSEARSTFPRSSIVASDRSSIKRPSPERGSDSVRMRSRDESSTRRRPASQGVGSGSLPRSSRREPNRVASDPTLDDLSVDPKDVNLNNLNRDCFIIPVHQVHRFLPEGVTVRLVPLFTLRRVSGQNFASQGCKS